MNNYWQLNIVDNGLGFDPKHSDTIFEIFHRLHSKGTSGSGIGIAICKKIVQNHNGIIKAVGEPGKGARFEICFPIQNAGFRVLRINDEQEK